jgi:hypothetical protein
LTFPYVYLNQTIQKKGATAMSFELLYFRDSDKILRKKKMANMVLSTLRYLDDCLQGTLYRGELLRQALSDMDWRQEPLSILDGRRYQYKGLKSGVAIDGSFSSYEYVQDALLRLQVGFDKKKIETGIVLLTGQRSEKSPLGSTRELVEQEIQDLYPTISMPVAIALFDLGEPGVRTEETEGVTPDAEPTSDDAHPAADNQGDPAPGPVVVPKVEKKQRRPRVRSEKKEEETCQE